MTRVWHSTCSRSCPCYGEDCGSHCGYYDHCELDAGERLYRVQATYSRAVPPVSYYVVAGDAQQAVSWFREAFHWLSLVAACEELLGSDAELVLGNAQKYSVHCA